MPYIDWITLNVISNNIYDDTFLTLLDNLLITQHITFSTKSKSIQTPSSLYLTLTNDHHVIFNMILLPPLDHIVIDFEFIHYYLVECYSIPRYLYSHGS